jgi:hypothetical protein
MRKKLLALLMCATMVLGSSAVAFAAPAADDYKAAQKVFDQGEDFDGEYAAQTLTPIYYTTINENTGNVNYWGFTSSGAHVKLSKDLVAYKYLGTTADTDYLKSGNYYVTTDGDQVAKINYEDDGVTVKSIEFQSYKTLPTAGDYSASDLASTTKAQGEKVTAIDAVNASATAQLLSGNEYASSGLIAINVSGEEKVGYIVVDSNRKDKTGDKIYYVNDAGETIGYETYSGTWAGGAAFNSTSNSADATGSSITYVAKPGTPVKYTVKDLVYTTDGIYTNYTSAGKIDSTNPVKYVEGVSSSSIPTVTLADADGYLTKTDKNVDLLKGSKNIVRSDSKETYWVVFSEVSSANQETYLKTVADAINKGTVSKDAVAVQAKVYKLVSCSDKDSNKQSLKELNSEYVLSSDVTLTLDADDFSRTNLADYSNFAVYSISRDYNTTDKVYRLVTLGNADAAGTITFDASNFNTGIFIFDGVAAESNNDGVSDTTTAGTTSDTAATTASTTAATSPKTGDVAPIAALAVVMMGACGALVVASKKRA